MRRESQPFAEKELRDVRNTEGQEGSWGQKALTGDRAFLSALEAVGSSFQQPGVL